MQLIRIIATILLVSNYAYSFEYNKYSNEEIEGICEEYINSIKGEVSESLKNNLNPNKSSDTTVINGKNLNIRFRLKYLGQIRELSNDALEDLNIFEKSFPQIVPKVSELSTKEVLMSAKSGNKYWLPIQDVLIEKLKKEATRNQEIYVYVVVLRHVINSSYQCRGNYLINEFQVVTKELLQKEKIKELYSKGQSLLKDKNLKQAEAVFKKILSLNPNHDDALSNLCLIDQERKQYDKAIQCYDKVIKLDSEASEAFFSKGNIFFEQNKPNEAIKELDKAIDLFYKQKLPSHIIANAYYLRADSKSLINSKDAIDDLKKARELNPRIVSQEKLIEFQKKLEID